MSNASIRFYLLNSFSDSSVSDSTWNELVSNSLTDVIFLTWQWQKTWWEVYGRGKLLIVVAESGDKPIAIAPLFADEGMIFFVGSGGSDYLDFIGTIKEQAVLEGMLDFAQKQIPGFLGFRFYHIPEHSPTHTLLTLIANQYNWTIHNESELPAPLLSIRDFNEKAIEATRKKSLLRHESWFKRNGSLLIEHLKTSEEILPHLNTFFDQHISRWEETPYPSLFKDNTHQLFYLRLTESLPPQGWLRFTRVVWNSTPVAFHFGFNYKGSFLWYKPTYDTAFSKQSPGEVLLRNLLLLALDEQAHTFDFGLGDEAFKQRFATSTPIVQTIGFYPN